MEEARFHGVKQNGQQRLQLKFFIEPLFETEPGDIC